MFSIHSPVHVKAYPQEPKMRTSAFFCDAQLWLYCPELQFSVTVSSELSYGQSRRVQTLGNSEMNYKRKTGNFLWLLVVQRARKRLVNLAKQDPDRAR